MRLLFTMDAKNYDPAGTRFSRPSVRGIILREGKIAMAHVRREDYYKFPGGGIEPGEDRLAALIREVREETGLTVIPESVKEYGRVYRVEKGDPEDVFEQENFYYFCAVEDAVGPQELDPSEREEGFSLEWVEPGAARARNLAVAESDYIYHRMARREAGVLALLMREGYLG